VAMEVDGSSSAEWSVVVCT